MVSFVENDKAKFRPASLMLVGPEMLARCLHCGSFHVNELDL